jgi:CheY-like chemotaxis protein
VEPLAAQRQISLQNEVVAAEADAETFVLADRQRLHQVMLNLLSNAIKYNREGGRVTLRVQAVNEKADGQATWRIAVSDTGFGISPENQTKIFLPFERLNAEATTEGTGIGLTLTRRLVELMNGSIGVESTLGQGSTFWVELPRAQSPAALAVPQTGDAARGGSLLGFERTVTILYIEDNVSNLTLMQNLLKEAPQVRLLTAMQGSIGLELARQHRPDLILLDLHLPGLSGEEVLRLLRSDDATSRIPVVVVSADATHHQINRLLTAGADHYITKPIDVRLLVGVLEEMFGGE